jgi:hypothetical protein
MSKEELSSAIHKLRIGIKLSLDEVEKALDAAINNVVFDKSIEAQEIELARIDLLQDETVVFLRGHKNIVTSLKATLIRKSPGTKCTVTKTTTTDLAKAL